MYVCYSTPFLLLEASCCNDCLSANGRSCKLFPLHNCVHIKRAASATPVIKSDHALAASGTEILFDVSISFAEFVQCRESL
jgi:hypothetical protein